LELSNFVVTLGLLSLGGIFAGLLLPALPFAANIWIAGLLTGIVQVLVLAGGGILLGKLDLWNVMIGGVVCFIGSIAGAWIASYISLLGGVVQVIALAIQALLLLVFGLVKGTKGQK